MGISVQVKPLCGAFCGALSYLVSVDGFNFLVDCGWNDHFDTSLLEPLSRVASTVDAVLLSHSDTLHLGALPYAMKQFGISAPVFATEPVYSLGMLTMYDHYYSRQQVSEFDLFTLDDIDYAFQHITRLTYSQNYCMSGKGEGIVVTPQAAGHLLGSAIWKITKDGEEVIYAVDFNHKKERHLNGTVLESLVRPAVLITDAYNALSSNQPPRPQKDRQFMDVVLRTLRADGKILVPVETAGRVLELMLILEQHWEQHHLNYPILFLTYVSSSTIDCAKSSLEWMSDSIVKSFEQTLDNAFHLKHVTLLSRKSEFEKVPNGPKIVFASMASLEVGYARDIFVEWAADSRNLVLFPERGQFGTLANMLQSDSPPKAIKVTISERIPLVGEELAFYEERRHRTRLEEDILMNDEDSKESMAIDVNVKQLSASSSADSLAWDDFGEVIDLCDYMVEDVDMDQTPMKVFHSLNGKLDEGFDTAPSKVVFSEQTIYINCSLVTMDFEGRSDGYSIKKIISHVAPLKLVLVHGSAEAKEHLRLCLKNEIQNVYAPQIEESVDVSSNFRAYKFHLSDKMTRNIQFKKIGDYKIAWIDAQVGKTENGKLTLLPFPSHPPPSHPPPHKTVLVGDIKMADFKQFLARQGIKVEFAGGILRCGEHVTLRKVGDSSMHHIIVEGPLSEEYYKICDHLHSQLFTF